MSLATMNELAYDTWEPGLNDMLENEEGYRIAAVRWIFRCVQPVVQVGDVRICFQAFLRRLGLAIEAIAKMHVALVRSCDVPSAPSIGKRIVVTTHEVLHL